MYCPESEGKNEKQEYILIWDIFRLDTAQTQVSSQRLPLVSVWFLEVIQGPVKSGEMIFTSKILKLL